MYCFGQVQTLERWTTRTIAPFKTDDTILTHVSSYFIETTYWRFDKIMLLLCEIFKIE
jgi:hypothetical protein